LECMGDIGSIERGEDKLKGGGESKEDRHHECKKGQEAVTLRGFMEICKPSFWPGGRLIQKKNT